MHGRILKRRGYYSTMALFNDMLKDNQTLFKNEIALDFSYMPKLIPYREQEQKQIAFCIKPLFQARNGKHLILTGRPGVGKTLATKHVLAELEDQTDEIVPIYINCWQKNTSYKVILDICDILDYKFTVNKKTDELCKIIKTILNKKAVVLVLDEIDKMEEYDLLYYFLEEIYRSCLILITNDSNWITHLDSRIKSRLMPDIVEFKPYSLAETKGILKQRVDAAFIPGVIDDALLDVIATKAASLQDIRSGLHLLRETGILAENDSSRKIQSKHVEQAIEKAEAFHANPAEELDADEQRVLEVVRQHPGQKIGDVYDAFCKAGGQGTYKTFQRKVKRLADGKFIEATKITGKEGNTTLLEPQSEKKLTEF